MNKRYARMQEIAVAARSCVGQGNGIKRTPGGKSMKSPWVLLLLAAALTIPAAALASGDLERAIEAYECSHYAESVQLLRLAAEDGNLRAQEMLGLMYLYGPTIYGAQVPRDLDQALHWLQRAASAGSAAAAHVLEPAYEQAARADASIGARLRSE
jgi:TPR repeat protein